MDTFLDWLDEKSLMLEVIVMFALGIAFALLPIFV
jgi:hypothetical protein